MASYHDDDSSPAAALSADQILDDIRRLQDGGRADLGGAGAATRADDLGDHVYQLMRSEFEQFADLLQLGNAQADELLARLAELEGPAAGAPGGPGGPGSAGGDDLALVLHEVRWLMVRHPLAARAVYRALAAEGRRFATSAEGKAWAERLASSELVRRVQLLWEVASGNALDDASGQVLPSQLIDAFCRAAARDDLERALGSSVTSPESGDMDRR